jgi:hypothetical protein
VDVWKLKTFVGGQRVGIDDEVIERHACSPVSSKNRQSLLVVLQHVGQCAMDALPAILGLAFDAESLDEGSSGHHNI